MAFGSASFSLNAFATAMRGKGCEPRRGSIPSLEPLPSYRKGTYFWVSGFDELGCECWDNKVHWDDLPCAYPEDVIAVLDELREHTADGTIPAEAHIPVGGTTGQLFIKQSEADFDGGWETIDLRTIGAVVPPDGGDGTVAGDLNAADFTGAHYAEPDGSIYIGKTDIAYFGHQNIVYRWFGPVEIYVGAAGDYTAVTDDLVATGTTSHAVMEDRDLPGQHPQSAIGGRGGEADLVADQVAQDGRLDTLEGRADETDTEQSTQDSRLTTLETRADETDTEQATQDTELARLESDKANVTDCLATFVFAAYGGMKYADSDPMPDIGSGWQALTGFDSLSVPVPRHVILDVAAGTFALDQAGIYVIMVNGFFDHNSSNSGRKTNIRFYNLTQGFAFSSEGKIATGRNAEGSNINVSELVAIDSGEVGDLWQLEIGGEDSYSAVEMATLSLSLFHVGEFQGTF